MSNDLFQPKVLHSSICFHIFCLGGAWAP